MEEEVFAIPERGFETGARSCLVGAILMDMLKMRDSSAI
jgi:hypothetical protein